MLQEDAVQMFVHPSDCFLILKLPFCRWEYFGKTTRSTVLCISMHDVQNLFIRRAQFFTGDEFHYCNVLSFDWSSSAQINFKFQANVGLPRYNPSHWMNPLIY
jgi:hypothetical protein